MKQALAIGLFCISFTAKTQSVDAYFNLIPAVNRYEIQRFAFYDKEFIQKHKIREISITEHLSKNSLKSQKGFIYLYHYTSNGMLEKFTGHYLHEIVFEKFTYDEFHRLETRKEYNLHFNKETELFRYSYDRNGFINDVQMIKYTQANRDEFARQPFNAKPRYTTMVDSTWRIMGMKNVVIDRNHVGNVRFEYQNRDLIRRVAQVYSPDSVPVTIVDSLSYFTDAFENKNITHYHKTNLQPTYTVVDEVILNNRNKLISYKLVGADYNDTYKVDFGVDISLNIGNQVFLLYDSLDRVTEKTTCNFNNNQKKETILISYGENGRIASFTSFQYQYIWNKKNNEYDEVKDPAIVQKYIYDSPDSELIREIRTYKEEKLIQKDIIEYQFAP